MSFPKFLHLPKELQQCVLLQCPRESLARLARSSSHLQSVALPLLYRYVDLSCHNDPGLWLTNHPDDEVVEADHPDRDYDSYGGLRKSQGLFIDRLLETPQLADQVLSLSWTYHCYHYSEWERFYAEDDEDEEVLLPSKFAEKMWAVFGLLRNVRHVDFCSMDEDPQLAVPPPLFPQATSICIGGFISYAMFRAIVYDSPGLQSLHLNNVQGFGQLEDGASYWVSYDEPANLTETETETEHNIPLLRHSGPMHGHLYPLIGKLPHLKYPTWSSIGRDHARHEGWSFKRELSRYSELVTFISSFSSTLENLILEHGVLRSPERPNEPLRDPAEREPQVGRPMDISFSKQVFPMLLTREWPKLMLLVISGHGGRPSQLRGGRGYVAGDQEIFIAEQCSFEEKFGSRLHWNSELQRKFYLYDTGCPRYWAELGVLE